MYKCTLIIVLHILEPNVLFKELAFVIPMLPTPHAHVMSSSASKLSY